jgi:hypothetical protein
MTKYSELRIVEMTLNVALGSNALAVLRISASIAARAFNFTLEP